MAENQQNSNNQIAGALTFPTRNEGNAQPLPVQPRQPRDLQGLLRFATEATTAEVAPSNSNTIPLTDESRRFLEEVLASLSVDMASVIKTCLKTIANEELMKGIQLGEPVPNEVKWAFENLFELIDDMDVANDFYKMGGFSIFPICLGSENEQVRALGCSALGDVCQNNPFCQAKALECGLLGVVLNLMQTDQGEGLVKEIYAVSCMCREYLPACEELVAQGGCAVLGGLVGAADLTARTKVAFLLSYLASHHPPAAEKFIEQNLVKTIAAQIKKGRDTSTEYLLNTILALVKINPQAKRQCADPEIQLKTIIEDHLKHPDLKSNVFREEKEYCGQLLKILESCPKVESVDENVDR